MISIIETIEILITVIAVGFIFSGLLKRGRGWNEPLHPNLFDIKNIKYSIIIAAPAIILHEFGHKLVALALGYSAVFHASLWGLAIGIFLRLSNMGFIFFVPAYVSIAGPSNPLNFATIAFAGPLVNLILFAVCTILLKQDRFPKYTNILSFTKQINLWLFILNMLPIPGFDGFKTYSSLLSLI